MKHEQETKYEHEAGRNFESLRMAAALVGRLKRAGLCACGRPGALVRRGHRWERQPCCWHCGIATLLNAPEPVLVSAQWRVEAGAERLPLRRAA
jgi:hypothetical protein